MERGFDFEGFPLAADVGATVISEIRIAASNIKKKNNVYRNWNLTDDMVQEFG